MARQNPDQHQHDGEREGEELGQGEASAAAEGNPAARDSVRAPFSTRHHDRHQARTHVHVPTCTSVGVHGPPAVITPLSPEQTVRWVFRRNEKIRLFVHIRVALRGSRWSQTSWFCGSGGT